MLAFTLVLLELGMWSRRVQAEQSSVKAHIVASIVTSGLQGVIDYILATLKAVEVLC
jgi:hypothetical protein